MIYDMPAGIHLIAAIGKHGQIGFDGKRSWHDDRDCDFFRCMTVGSKLIVDADTAAALPPLAACELLIDDPRIPVDVFIVNRQIDPIECVWVIGGADIYARWLPHVRHIILTRIDYDGPTDSWMPPLWPAPSMLALMLGLEELSTTADWNDATDGPFQH